MARLFQWYAEMILGATLTLEKDLHTTTCNVSDAEVKKQARFMNSEANTKEESRT